MTSRAAHPAALAVATLLLAGCARLAGDGLPAPGGDAAGGDAPVSSVDSRSPDIDAAVSADGAAVDLGTDLAGIDLAAPDLPGAYLWTTTPWGECSEPCGGGEQQRTVTCVDGAGQPVLPQLCMTPPPAATQTCNVPPCDWDTGTWSVCSVSCGGGTATRAVTCETTNGLKVDEKYCVGAKPDTSKTCNSDPCCQTFGMHAKYTCSGTAQFEVTNWGSNTGSSADQASCAAHCMANRGGLKTWCCALFEDDGSSINWVCALVDGSKTATSLPDRYAGAGVCQAP